MTLDQHSSRFWASWYGLTIVVLFLVPAAKFGVPVWSLPRNELLPFAVELMGYALAAAIPTLRYLQGKPVKVLDTLVWALAIFGVMFAALTLAGISASRVVLLAVAALATILIPLTFALRRRATLVLFVLVAIAVASLGLGLYKAYGPEPKVPARTKHEFITSAFYNLEAVVYEGRIPKPAARGGGLSRIADRFLLGTGDGHLYLLKWSDRSDDLAVTPLTLHVPANGEEFARAVGLRYEQPRNGGQGGEAVGGQVETFRFRVTDVLVQELGANVRVFAAHHYWHNSERCFVIRVSMTEGSRQAFMDGASGFQWKTIYETKPCMPIEGEQRERSAPFEGNLTGGRLALFDPRTLLLTVGFHGFDGVMAKQAFSQDPAVAWGTTVLIHPDDATSETFSIGHRNEQGLYIAPDGAIWETEHGPQGGDELNLLLKGGNYGWPFVTYGTDYGTRAWPLSKAQGRHDGYREPMFAWTPSIGISNLIGVEQDLFPIWKGDLLISSLREESLYRVRIMENRVIFVEPIRIGRRIRDVKEGSDGRIIMWADDAAIVSLRPAAGTSREQRFASTCGGCHKVVDGKAHQIGPDLYGVVGRRIASAEGYADYSAALRRQDGSWTEERLDKFLTQPQAVVPGTNMVFQGVPDPAARAEIIAYLKSRP